MKTITDESWNEIFTKYKDAKFNIAICDLKPLNTKIYYFKDINNNRSKK